MFREISAFVFAVHSNDLGIPMCSFGKWSCSMFRNKDDEAFTYILLHRYMLMHAMDMDV